MENKCGEAPTVVAALEDISLLEFLKHDHRPTLVLDNAKGSIVFQNEVFERLQHRQGLDRQINLSSWAAQLVSTCQIGKAVLANAHLWTCAVVENQWIVVSGVCIPQHGQILPGHATNEDLSRVMMPASVPSFVSEQMTDDLTAEDNSSLDLTSDIEPTNCSSYIKWLRTFDWANSRLGPLSSWSNELRLAFNWLVRDRRPATMYWGDHLTLLYNEAFIPMFIRDQKHLLGLECSNAWKHLEAWPEYRLHLGNMFASGYQRGESHVYRDQQIFLDTSWGIEERFFDYSFTPIVISSGRTAGFYQAFTETTDSFRNRRQDDTVRAVKGAVEHEVKSTFVFWNQVLEGLTVNAFDVPFAIAYTHEDHSFARNMKTSAAQTVESDFPNYPCAFIRLEAQPGMIRRPVVHDALMSHPSFQTCLRHTCESRTQQRFDLFDRDLRDLFHRTTQDNPFSDKVTTLCLLPICPNGDVPRGILLLGLNPRRRLDQSYQRFLDAIVQEVSAIYKSNERVKHADEITMLKQQRFDKLASVSTAGLFEIDLDGKLLYTNKRWHEISGVPGPVENLSGPTPWLPYLTEDYIDSSKDAWNEILDGKHISYELKWKGRGHAKSGITGESVEIDGNWSLATGYMHVPEGHPEMATIMGCLVEINQQKQATEDALERKRQQENFVDMTSHEMRNPMSAVLQSADSIIAALQRLMRLLNEPGTNSCDSVCLGVVENCLDAAQTIIFCTQHQKRIIDDVLNLSKFNSHLLTFDPCPFDPSLLLKRCDKIFKAEVAANGLDFRTETCASYHELVQWVHMDPSRTQQILVNLITNAIKFTTEQSQEKVISLRLGASTTEPTHFEGVDFSQGRPLGPVIGQTTGEALDSRDTVYIVFSVADTGCGMDQNGLDKLFTRFFQAPQRSHVKYDGSGLGLYIARRLTELQGGRIGVTSKVDSGSTFAFYIKAERCATPDEVPTAVYTDPVASKEDSMDLTASSKDLQHAERLLPPKVVDDRILENLNLLICEDNLINQRVLAKQLRILGGNVSVANHGQEALDHLRRTIYWHETADEQEADRLPLDVMLLDVEMPVMDGITCVREIRRLEQEGDLNGYIPVIAITANARKEQMDNAKAAGMDSVVSKPFRIPELVATIRELLQSKGHAGNGTSVKPELSSNGPDS